MPRIRLAPERAKRLAIYHAENGGFDPVIESDADLLEWVEFTLEGFAPGTMVVIREDAVVLDISQEYMADVQLSWLD